MTNLIIAESDKKDLQILERVCIEIGGLEISKVSKIDNLFEKLSSQPQILILGYNFFESEKFSTAYLVKEILNSFQNTSIIVSGNKFDSSIYFNLYASGASSCLNYNRIDWVNELTENIKEIKQKHILNNHSEIKH